jgi:hypothetical protein
MTDSDKTFGVFEVFYGDYTHSPYHTPLKSALPSATQVLRTLQEIESAEGVPEWIQPPEKPCPLTLENEVKRRLTHLAEKGFQSGSEVLLCYFVGHGYGINGGHPLIYTHASDPSIHFIGIALNDILEVISVKYSGHLILCLDICRTQHGGQRIQKQNIKQTIENFRNHFKSIAILSSSVHGEFTPGGTSRFPVSPFAHTLTQILNDRSNRLTPRKDLTTLFMAQLEQFYREEKLRHALPEIEYTGEGELSLLAFNRFQRNVRQIIHKIIQRESDSFLEDQFLSDVEEILPLEVEDESGNTVVAHTFLKENNNPALVVGLSGAGKTILAKKVSLLIAQEHQETRLSLYLYALKLEELEEVSVIRVFQENLVEWRYKVQGLDEGALKKLLKEVHFIVFIDGVDELKDLGKLRQFLKGMNAYNMTPVLFCQPQNYHIYTSLLQSTSLQILKLRPLSLNQLQDVSIQDKERLKETIGEYFIPSDFQLIRKYMMAKKKVPHSQSDIEGFALSQIRTLISEILKEKHNQYKKLEEKLSAFPDAVKEEPDTSPGEQLFLIFCQLANELREKGYFQEFPEGMASFILGKILRKQLPNQEIEKTVWEILELGIDTRILRQTSGKGTPLRFYHSKNQDRFIAAWWKHTGIPQSLVTERAAQNLWESVIPEYGLLADPDAGNFSLKEIATYNPFCAALCIDKGYPATPGDISQIGNELLKKGSQWVRNRASNLLSILSTGIVDWMKNRFHHTTDVKEKITIVLALGYIGGRKNISFLHDSFTLALKEEGDQNSYFRRRILDALIGRLHMDKIEEWSESKRDFTCREWSRFVRSARIQEKEDLDTLNKLSSCFCDQDSMALIGAFLTYHQFRLEKRKIHDLPLLEGQIGPILERVIKSPVKWHRCMASLLILDANLKGLSNTLHQAFLNEQDPYAKGDMAYVLGKVGTKDQIESLLDFYGTATIKGSRKEQEIQEGLLNDVELGLKEAAKRSELTKGMIENFNLPQDKKHRLLTVIRYN